MRRCTENLRPFPNLKIFLNLCLLKRLAAILLMGILLFNWYGYQLLSTYLQNKADRRLEASLDRDNYDESQLIPIHIPITALSYYNSSTSFERVDGQLEINGIRYKYVKRRLFKDSLELLCIPNQAAMSLQSAKEDFFRQVNDLQQHSTQGKKTSHSGPNKAFSQDYNCDTYTFTSPGLLETRVGQRQIHAAGILPSRPALTPDIPPDQDSALS